MAKIRGSKNGKIITARFNGHAKSLFPTMKQTKALVLLSIIGNEFCTTDYLKSIIDEALKTHDFTTFLIADEVYWHNLRQKFSKDEEVLLKEKAMDLGAAYIEDHLGYFLSILGADITQFNAQHAKKSTAENMSIVNEIAKKHANFEIVCWRDWLDKSPSFHEKKETIMALYDTEELLKKSVEQTANNFSKRCHQSTNEPIELLHQRSKGYLIEESSAVMWIAASLGYHFIVYPGEMIKPFKTTKEFFIKDGDSSASDHEVSVKSVNSHLLVNWLEVSFQRSHEFCSSTPKASLEQIFSETNPIEISSMMKGVTEGIFSLVVDNETKVNLLVDIFTKCTNRIFPVRQD